MKPINELFPVYWAAVAASAPEESPGAVTWRNTVSDVFGRLVYESGARTAVEVGSWRGGSAIQIADEMILRLKEIADAMDPGNPGQVDPLGMRLYCVDTWLGGADHLLSDLPHDSIARDEFGASLLYREFLWNVSKAGLSAIVQPMQCPSSVGAKLLRAAEVEADLVYLDGSHEHDDVFADLVAYHALLRPGGILFGDDRAMPGVHSAVARFINVAKIDRVDVDGPFWIIRKPGPK